MKSVDLGHGAFALEPSGSQSDGIRHFNEDVLAANGVGQADIDRYRILLDILSADDGRPAANGDQARTRGVPSPRTR
ncbi:hypothetical protein FHR71_003948 [Methylobacterium sp. RAS18]|nr:hypothetical protein [Methylobacterium sp. RAS18]